MGDAAVREAGRDVLALTSVEEFELYPKHTGEPLKLYLNDTFSLAACGGGRGVSEKGGQDAVTDSSTVGFGCIRAGPLSPR